MKPKLFVLTYFLLVTNLFSQWYWQNPIPQGNNLNEIHMVNANVGFAVGDLGTVLKTTDGGVTWNQINLGTTAKLYSVYFVGENVGYIAGENGIIFKTINSGKTWQTLDPKISISFYSVYFLSGDIGFICGYYGYILVTTDGGLTWSKKNSKTINTLYKIYFVNKNLGFAIGKEGTITRTTDGGNSWTGISVDMTVDLKSICFADDTSGWVLSYSKIFGTADGGKTWQQQYSSSSTNLSALWSKDKNKVRAFGSRDVITADGGKTWTEIPNTGNNFNSISFIDSLNGWGISNSGKTCRTVDGGETWKLLSSSVYEYLTSVFFLNENSGWAVGWGTKGVLKTTNSGSSWVKVPYEGYPNRVFFKNESVGYIIYYSVIKTSDGGQTWDTVYNNNRGFIPSASFVDSCIWFVDQGNRIVKSTDDGKNWRTVIAEDARNLQAVFFLDKQNGWAAGGSASIVKSTDGGNSWVGKESNVKGIFYSVFFADKNNGWMCGHSTEYGGIILHTTDGGDTWRLQSNGQYPLLNSIFFTDNMHGWSVGYDGTILQTADGGNAWTLQRKITVNDLRDVFFVNSGTGWIVGNNTILKTTNGGITFVEEKKNDLPTDFVLYQNYPNPFNPITTIKFCVPVETGYIPSLQYVTLKVYDLLGREIVTLVDEEKSPGNYEVKFDGANLPSGVYFCRLISANFAQTKKLVLLK